MDMSSDEELAAPPSRKSKTDYGNNDSSYEDEEDDNPFPLEGKYIDEADRKRFAFLLPLPSICSN